MFISYAQNFEDVMLWRALQHVEKGRYIDIGAQDPVADSVSLAFYERGWRGIHVEPVPIHAADLRAARPDETVIEAAVGETPGLVEMFEVPDTGLSTGVLDIADLHAASGLATRRFEVPCITLSTLLDRQGEHDIHWMKVDVEGMEASVLRSWLPSSVRPWIVVVEATFPRTPAPAFADWDPVIVGLGYRMVYFDGLNRFYVSDRHPELASAFTTPPNVFDGFALSGFGCHQFTEVLLDRHRRAADEAAAHAAKQRAAAETELVDLSSRLSAATEQSRQLQAEVSGQSDRAAALEARLEDAINREKELVGEVRAALSALQTAALTQREDRERASALETELRARETTLTELGTENLRLRSEVSARERAQKAGSAESLPSSASELLELHDEDFVRKCFMTLLDRPGDLEGLNNYVRQVRAGISKSQIVADMVSSPEGRKIKHTLPGLAPIVEAQRRARPNLLQRLLRWLGRSLFHPVEVRLNALENRLHSRTRVEGAAEVPQSDPVAGLSGVDRHSGDVLM